MLAKMYAVLSKKECISKSIDDLICWLQKLLHNVVYSHSVSLLWMHRQLERPTLISFSCICAFVVEALHC